MSHISRERGGTRRLLLALLFLLLGAGSGWACRIIYPPPHWWHPHPPFPVPPPEPAPRALAMEVRSHQATIDIRRGTAHVRVEAVFYNPNPFRVEGAYLFPIGRQAAVSSFAMTVDGKTLEADLLEADKARQIYEDIVRRQKDPALLEYLDQGLLRARVFPIEPQKEVAVTLTYDDVVRRDGALSRFSYPLLSARPEAGGAIGKLRLEVTLNTEAAAKSVFCPGFDAAVTRAGDHTARVTVETARFTPDKDFEVVWSEGRGPVAADFLSFRRGDDGYFLLLVNPDSELQQAEIGAKDITFVLDTSGSMMGSKIQQAKEALLFCVDSLNPADTFNLVTFATDVIPFAPAPLPATAGNRDKARAFIREIKPFGGTAIDEALALVQRLPLPEGRVGLVVFMTDGLPTVGEVEPAKILARFAEKQGRRVFPLGVGYDVSTRLLDGLAARTGGYASYVRPGENLEVALGSFYEKIAFPVMTDLQLDSGGARLAEVSPRALPDLFKGAQLMVTGRFTGEAKAKMKLSGTIGGTREHFPFEADLAGDPRNAFIPRLWAVSRVGFLQEELRLRGENQELIDEIRRLGREYGILTPYTSFLVVEQSLPADRIPVARETLGRVEAEAAADSGRSAVEGASMARAMKAAGAEARGLAAAPGLFNGVVAAPGGSGGGLTVEEVRRADASVAKVHDKTFYRRADDGVWYDSVFGPRETPQADIEVQAWSKEFFDLLVRYPALRKYMLAGEELVVRLDGKVIRVRAE